jgi:hypothetical protein
MVRICGPSASLFSSSHFPAAPRALAAGIDDVFLHADETFAIVRALNAYLGAFAGGLLMVFGSAQPELR